jgi:hypothetical protein
MFLRQCFSRGHYSPELFHDGKAYGGIIPFRKAMRSYHISPYAPSARRRVVGAAISTTIAVALLLVVNRGHQRFIDLIAFAVLLNLASYLMESAAPGFDLEVDNDEIRVVRDGSVKRTIPRDRIRLVYEFNNSFLGRPGLVVFERGLFRSWPLGGVSIPKDLPQYDEIKAQVTNWPQR